VIRKLVVPMVCGLWLLPACVVSQRPDQHPGVSPGRVTCTVHELSRHPLRLENGDYLYVAPKSLVANATGEALLAGTPNYIFRRDEEGAGHLIGRDSLFGAVVGTDGQARPVLSPIDPRRVLGVSALARADGGWDVVFGELHSPRGLGYVAVRDSIVRLWHGVYDGNAWSALDSLPVPPRTVILPHHSSALARTSDRLAWAQGALVPGQSFLVIIHERVSSGWEYELVFTPYSSSPAIAYTESATLMLAGIGAEPVAPNSEDHNSLAVWIRDPVWRQLRRVVAGSRDGSGFQPSLVRSGGRVALTWQSEAGTDRVLLTIPDLLASAPDAPLIVDARIPPFGQTVTLALPGEGLLWTTLHVRDDGESDDLQLLSSHMGSRIRVGRTPNPFLGKTFQVTPFGPSELLLSGAQENVTAQLAYSLVLKARLACPE
jgi:hypothetical protein